MQVSRLTRNLVLLLALLSSGFVSAQTTVTIGAGTSSSSTRGPFQRADTNSSTVFSRWHHVYTQSELSNAGIPNGASIEALNWELASSNLIIGSGNATLKVYIKNSSATVATTGAWTSLIGGSSLAVDTVFNTTNNFPGANGWMPFTFDQPFTYTGGALEISVDWDCSQVSTPMFDGNGAIKFRWESTSPNDLVAKKTASSSAPSTISDLKDERANIQFVYNAAACDAPNSLYATNHTSSSVEIGWGSSLNAATYNWKVVAAGAGSSATAVDSGSTANLLDTVNGLDALTSYDFYVEADCPSLSTTSGYTGPHTFMTEPVAQLDYQVGFGTSSSSTRGPLQRSDTNSSTVFSRWNQVFTAAELATAGVSTGDSIVALNWELASSNTIIGTGNATVQIYIRNTSATSATSDTWTNLTSGSDLVVDNVYNTAHNFPGANGWMPFHFNQPFNYTGGAIEVAFDWDNSQVSTPAFSGDGSLKWRWESTAPDDLVAKKTASSSAPSTLSDLSDQRANIQFVTAITQCGVPVALGAINIDSTSANFFWNPVTASGSYNWKVVPAGAGPNAAAVDSGTVVGDTNATATNLATGTSYDFYVESDCGGLGTSAYAGPFSFTTLCGNVAATIVTATATDATCNGGADGAVDISIVSGIAPYQFNWSNSDTTQDITGLTAGSYFLTITDGNGCPSFASAVVNEPAAIALSTTTVTDVSCNGDADGAIDITTAGGTAPYGYAWVTGATTEDVTGLAAGSYSVTITDDNGCTFIDDVTVNEPDAISLSAVTTTDASCNGDSDGEADITVTGGTAPYAYAWSSGASTEDVTGLAAGTYTVTITDDNGCTYEDGATINEPDAISASSTSVPDTANGSVGSASVTVTGGTAPFSYEWDGTPGSSDSTGLAAGTYNVVVTDANGCTESVMVTVDNVVGIHDINGLTHLSIWPNPTNGLAMLEMEMSQNTAVQVSIYTITGELVETLQRDNVNALRHAIDLTSYGEGLYFVRVNMNEQTLTQKIIFIR